MKINQLPKVASSPSSSSTSHQHFFLLSCPDHHLSTSLFSPFTSLHLTLTSQPLVASVPPSIHTAVLSHSHAHPALMYCPLLPLSPPAFLLPLSFSLSTTLYIIPPSIRLSNGHQGRESPCSCLGQTLITHTHSHSGLRAQPSILYMVSSSLQHTAISKLKQLQEPKWYKWFALIILIEG